MLNFKNIFINLVTIFAFFTLMALGTWQIDRLGQKNDLLKKIQRVSEDISDLKDVKIDDSNLDDWLYRKIKIHGEFISEENIFVFTHLSDPRGKFGGAGYWVLNPFKSDEGNIIIINRGFIPQNVFDQFSSSANKYKENIVTGYVRKFEKENIFTPDKNMEDRILYLFEKNDIKKMFHIKKIEPYFIDQVDEYNALPQSNETQLKFPNNHLSYAITWYGLATALLFIYFYSIFRPKKFDS
ncbi:MAG: SURF1 family cytochrome oxidase biogenesis protein [Pseudomonadota bacterium]|nr:SURF1 family cytochrome oxidase biogenesis protein [Pseudomonadota bacterium]